MSYMYRFPSQPSYADTNKIVRRINAQTTLHKVNSKVRRWKIQAGGFKHAPLAIHSALELEPTVSLKISCTDGGAASEGHIDFAKATKIFPPKTDNNTTTGSRGPSMCVYCALGPFGDWRSH